MGPDFEDVLEIVGSYGRYQKLMVLFVLIPTSFLIAVSVSSIVFQTVVPDKYWCNPNGRRYTNYTEEEWWNVTVPRSTNGNFEKCLQYLVELEEEEEEEEEHAVAIDRNVVVDCESGWTHNRKSFYETMATSRSWLCEKELYSAHIFSINNFGNAAGTFLLPILADKFTGRRAMFFIASGIHLFFNLLVLIVPYYTIVLVLRFFGGMAFQTNYQMPYVTGMELMCPDKRAVVTFYSFAAWTLGMCFTSLVAWLIPHWWYLAVIACVPSLLFFGYWRFIPESPRWLLARGKTSECCDILLKISKINEIKGITRDTLEKALLQITHQKEEVTSFQEIFKYNRVLINGLVVTSMSFLIFMGYGCLLINVKILPNNYFLSFFVLSFFELPSNLFSYFWVHYLGRKFTNVMTSSMTMIFCLIATFFLDNRVGLLAVVAMIKVFVVAGIYVVYIITCELFPTSVRSTGMGIVIVAGMVGVSVSPYIVSMAADGTFQYWMIMGLNLAYFLLSFALPETIGLPLPQTFPEADVIGRQRPHFKWIHHWNKHLYQAVPLNEPKENEKL